MKLFFIVVLFLLCGRGIFPQSVEKGLSLKGTDEKPGKRWAIVVGINDYADSSISDLTKARNDAKDFAKLLEEKGEFDYVFTFTDDLEFRSPLFPTRDNIENKVDFILNEATENDLILVFFSGHGVNDKNGNGYLVTVDSRIKDPLSTALKIDTIVSKINRKNIKKSLLILDACREIINREEKGIGDSGLKEKKFEEAEIAATFYSTREGYYSYEDEKMSNGVYTSFLIQGMKGEADANNDGIVTLSELEIYVQNSVNDWATKNSKKQKPFTKIYKEKHGDLGIVSSPRKPTPEEVKAQNKEKDKVTFHIPAPFKSAVLPGWGQFSNDQKIKGGLFASAFLLGGGYLISKYADHSSAMNEYNGAKNMTNLSFLANTYPESFYLSLYGYRSGISAQSKMTGLSRDFSAAALAVSLFYAYNIFDAWYFSKAESPKTAGSFHWNLNYQKEFTPVSGQMQGMYTVEYTERF